MKCWNLAFNAQGSRLIIVLVQLRSSENTFSSSGGAEAKRKDRRKLSLLPKLMGFLSFIPRWMLMYFFAGFFLNPTLGMTKLKVLVLCFSYFTDNSIMSFCIFFWQCWCQSIASNLSCVTIFSWVSSQAWNEFTLLFSMSSQIFVLLPTTPLELESYFPPLNTAINPPKTLHIRSSNFVDGILLKMV
jgi:hypothetical protein